VIARTCTGVLALAAVGLGTPARAQVPAPPRGPRVQGAGFAIARATSTGSMAVYAAHGLGPGLAMAGFLATPASGYRAVVGGVGTRVRLGRSSEVVAILTGAQATDGPSVRLYLLPAVGLGRMTASATATAYHPVGATGRREVALNPLTVLVRAVPALRAGVAVVFHAAEERPTRAGVGPALQVRTPVGALSLQFLPFGLARPEVRGSFRAAF
jgi:hypothetical protein